MAKAKKKTESDPTMKMPGALLWIFCAPAAVVVSAMHSSKKSMKKYKDKKAKKDAEFNARYPEWWFYSD